MRKEYENYGMGILLENFWCKVIFGTQFALLLFLRNLMSSILSSIRGLSFAVKRPLVKKQVEVIYSNYSQAFFKENLLMQGELR